MILTKKQLIAETKAFSYSLLLKIKEENYFNLLDDTIARVMQVYEQCASDCLISTSLGRAKKNREILALTALCYN